MVAVQLYVEGGGDSKALRTACREGFRKLLEKAGLVGRMPRISASGDRRSAYNDFCTALRSAGSSGMPLLLVDSESAVTAASPWDHVKYRPGDDWEKPQGATDEHLHLMVECMETWFLADRPALRVFFGQGFRENALPAATAKIEAVSKTDVYDKLENATRDTKTKGAYGKSEHSFKLLAAIDPASIRQGSPWAERFFATLARLTSGVAP